MANHFKKSAQPKTEKDDVKQAAADRAWLAYAAAQASASTYRLDNV